MPLVGFDGAPTMSPKYCVAYAFGTFSLNARSKAYLMSSHLTARLTGGENLTPSCSLIVMDLPSSAISGSPSAMSGICLELSSGEK